MNWTLPRSLEIGGKPRKINTDFRDILDIIERLNDLDTDDQTRLYVCLNLFYDDFKTIPESCWEEAANKMMWFIACGEEQETHRPKTIDWEQDQQMIIADINKAAGQEVRALPYVHWWTFISWFNSIGEGQLSFIVSIREKIRKHQKLSDYERDFYRENRSKIDLKRKYTAAEKAEMDEWEKLLSGK